jgi:GTPase
MGSPNAGKSVLLNVLVEDKLAATSRKRHTTQREILGVVNHQETQLAFYDTPGYETPFSKSQYQRKYSVELSKIAVASTQKADVVLLVVDAYKRIDDKVMIEFAAMVRVST